MPGLGGREDGVKVAVVARLDRDREQRELVVGGVGRAHVNADFHPAPDDELKRDQAIYEGGALGRRSAARRAESVVRQDCVITARERGGDLGEGPGEQVDGNGVQMGLRGARGDLVVAFHLDLAVLGGHLVLVRQTRHDGGVHDDMVE